MSNKAIPTPEKWLKIARLNNEASDILKASEQTQAKKVTRKVAKAKVTSEGTQSATRANLAFALETYHPQYDSFLDRIELELDGKIEPLGEEVTLEVAMRLETDHGFKRVFTKDLIEVIKTVAYRNKFDSAWQWGNWVASKWDGKRRIERLFADYLGCEDREFTTEASKYFATAMAARLMTQNPEGEKADMIPILVGAQGLGKTTSVQALAPLPNTFVEVSFNRREDDMARMIKGKLIGEIAELSGLKTREAGDIKAWVSRQKEAWIPKYSEHEKNVPRRIMFIGTTNEQDFLADKTGNRRWLPMKVVRQADLEKLKADLEQLWGEAIITQRKRGILWQVVERLAESEHEEYLVVEPWEDEVMTWVKTDKVQEGKTRYDYGFVSVTDVLKNCLKLDSLHHTRTNQAKVASILLTNGFVRVKGQRRVAYSDNPLRGYELQTPP